MVEEAIMPGDGGEEVDNGSDPLDNRGQGMGRLLGAIHRRGGAINTALDHRNRPVHILLETSGHMRSNPEFTLHVHQPW